MFPLNSNYPVDRNDCRKVKNVMCLAKQLFKPSQAKATREAYGYDWVPHGRETRVLFLHD